MGVRVSGSKRIATTEESEIYSVPGNYVAYLKRLRVTNESAELAIVTVRYYSGAHGRAVLVVAVPPSSTASLSEEELPLEGCPTRVTAASTSQPYSVDYSLELE